MLKYVSELGQAVPKKKLANPCFQKFAIPGMFAKFVSLRLLIDMFWSIEYELVRYIYELLIKLCQNQDYRAYHIKIT